MKLWKLSAHFSGSILLVTVLFGCATLYGNNDREIYVNSTPSGAHVYLHGVEFGITPTSLIVPDARNVNIVLYKPGYKVYSQHVDYGFQKAGYWDLLFPPFFLVDMGSGCMFSLRQTRISANLESSSLCACSSKFTRYSVEDNHGKKI